MVVRQKTMLLIVNGQNKKIAKIPFAKNEVEFAEAGHRRLYVPTAGSLLLSAQPMMLY